MTTSTAHRYRWSELPADRPMERLERRRILGDLMMVARIDLDKGCSVPCHAHANEQIACVLSGRMRFGLGHAGDHDYHEVVLEGGEVLHLPPNAPHSAYAEEDSVVLDMFAPPSETTGIDRH